MNTKTIYITEPDTIDAEQAGRLLEATGYTCIAGDTEFSGSSDGCEALLIRSATHVDSRIKDYFPALKSVIRVGAGLDNVDLGFCKQNGITVFNAPGANADAVAEYVAGMTLYATRKFYLLEKQDAATWNRFKFRGDSIARKTIGIVGFGNIGKLVYRKLQGLGCTSFVVYDPYVTTEAMEAYEGVKQVGLDHLFEQADVVSLHIPLTDETRYTVGVKTLPLFKRDVILINASRGGIVDESSLLAHMRNNPEMIYIADTVENEPHVNEALLGQPNVIVTPHIASLTSDAEAAMLEQALKNFIDGKSVGL
jgi:phosphoglycerate dehydrogenase-like enzyme